MIKKAEMLLLLMGAFVLLFNGCLSIGGNKQAEWKPCRVSKQASLYSYCKISG